MADRNLTAEDVVSAIRTLDEAAGADSNLFRWRVRLFLRNEADLAERKRLVTEPHARLAAEYMRHSPVPAEPDDLFELPDFGQ